MQKEEEDDDVCFRLGGTLLVELLALHAIPTSPGAGLNGLVEE
jgi:hypothetical protein